MTALQINVIGRSQTLNLSQLRGFAASFSCTANYYQDLSSLIECMDKPAGMVLLDPTINLDNTAVEQLKALSLATLMLQRNDGKKLDLTSLGRLPHFTALCLLDQMNFLHAPLVKVGIQNALGLSNDIHSLTGWGEFHAQWQIENRSQSINHIKEICAQLRFGLNNEHMLLRFFELLVQILALYDTSLATCDLRADGNTIIFSCRTKNPISRLESKQRLIHKLHEEHLPTIVTNFGLQDRSEISLILNTHRSDPFARLQTKNEALFIIGSNFKD